MIDYIDDDSLIECINGTGYGDQFAYCGGSGDGTTVPYRNEWNWTFTWM
jgi:hypothetical protein